MNACFSAKHVVREDVIKVCKNANITIIKLVTGRLTAHQHIKVTSDANNGIVITFGPGR